MPDHAGTSCWGRSILSNLREESFSVHTQLWPHMSSWRCSAASIGPRCSGAQSTRYCATPPAFMVADSFSLALPKMLATSAKYSIGSFAIADRASSARCSSSSRLACLLLPGCPTAFKRPLWSSSRASAAGSLPLGWPAYKDNHFWNSASELTDRSRYNQGRVGIPPGWNTESAAKGHWERLTFLRIL